MNKSNAKTILEELYHDIINKIDKQDETVSKEDIIDFMTSSLSTISNLDFELPNALETLKKSLDEQFKDIAKQSLENYDQTNKRFEELATKQEKTLSELGYPAIDIDELKLKFDDIQLHMFEEVKKANILISHLTQQLETLEKTSQLDHLTKVYNRKMLSEHLSELFKTNGARNEIHLFMIDIDDFKNINDTYGHMVGDKVLIFLANILRKTLRDGDKIYRYGGEEFVILLNRIKNIECINVAQRVVSLIHTNKLIYKGANIHVTISLGATSLQEGDTPESFIARADTNLYSAKNKGKNRISLDGENGI